VRSLSTTGQGLKTSLEDWQLAYPMLRDPQLQVATDTKTVLIIALVSIISPMDLMPEAIPLLGLLRQAVAALERSRQQLRTT
jgi:uncharacterized membrane protein YkvA (DUF1232 family)